MKTQSADTASEMERILIEGYRKMSAWEKLQRVREWNRFLETLALADIRRRHPQADEHECALRAAARRIEPDVMRRLLGWDVDEKGF